MHTYVCMTINIRTYEVYDVSNTAGQIMIPKDPDMSWERDFPCNPIVGMGLGPSNLL